MRRAPPYVFALLGFVACAGAAQPAQTPASGAWTELRVSWDFGPCPADGRSCHQQLVVKPDGAYVAVETPNVAGGNGEPVRRFAALDAQETRELVRIVVPAFAEKVGAFGCPPEHDATVTIEIDGPWGTRREEVGGCVHASNPSAPRSLVDLLARHRFEKRDAPGAPSPPTGQGDQCTVAVGCAKGLVCAVFPCVVAPCTVGSCQKAGK